MLKHIWLPEGLYRWIPRMAFGSGVAGMVLIGPSVFWTPVSILIMGYGACVLLTRAIT